MEAVEVKQLHLDVGAAPAEVIDAGPEEREEGVQAAEVIPRELAPETLPSDVLDVIPGKQEEQVIEASQHELPLVVAPRVIPDAAAKDEEMKEQSVEEVVVPQEEVHSKEEAQCEAGRDDQHEELVPKDEPALKKSDDLSVSQEDSPNDKVDVQLPEKDTTLLGMPEDEARASMEFEEWEGIERSEVEKRFGAAAAFAASDTGAAALSKLNTDVQLQLQGLLKVAVDGPCYDAAQPLTLRPSSRAKWVSWQKLGNMHPEIAMEKYMNLLSEFIPGWMGDATSSTEKHKVDVDSEGALLTMTTHTSDPQINQGNEGSASIDEGPLTSPPNPEIGICVSVASILEIFYAKRSNGVLLLDSSVPRVVDNDAAACGLCVVVVAFHHFPKRNGLPHVHQGPEGVGRTCTPRPEGWIFAPSDGEVARLQGPTMALHGSREPISLSGINA
ncbi:unnamed protein product [Triticum turgidum subsp. durum]|uniref:ACB domain-containing protein n=1 Tax=Triticum turgidum subsp. durum TaxID=4567 RepID=A0A9R0S5J4_TRITD|nr:unnamed protein product [Triticum turgidum subsp. durum]